MKRDGRACVDWNRPNQSEIRSWNLRQAIPFETRRWADDCAERLRGMASLGADCVGAVGGGTEDVEG